MSALPVLNPKSSRSLSPVHHINVAFSIRLLYQFEQKYFFIFKTCTGGGQVSRVLYENTVFLKNKNKINIGSKINPKIHLIAGNTNAGF